MNLNMDTQNGEYNLSGPNPVLYRNWILPYMNIFISYINFDYLFILYSNAVYHVINICVI